MLGSRRVSTVLAVGGLLLLAASGIARASDQLQGFSAERLQRLGTAVKSEMTKGTIPGAVVLVARNGHIVHFEAYGFLDGARTRPMPKDSLFRLFSMTKPITSVAIMMLVERGDLNLDDPVAKYLPELKDLKVEVRKNDPAGSGHDLVPAARPVTILDLLRHTSGFTYSFGGARSDRIKQLYLEHDVEQQKGNIPAEEMLRRVAKIPLAFHPGTAFEYGISTDILGFVLERIVGKRLDMLLDDMIFKPLKMTDASFQVTDAAANRLADALDTDPLRAWAWQWARVTAKRGDGYVSGGGGMVGTAHDYFRFAQMILNGGELDGVRLLSRKTIDYMLSDHLVGLAGSTAPTTGPGYSFGLGFAVRLHDGMGVTAGSKGDAMWAGLGGTSFTIDRQEKLLGIFLAAGPASRNHTRFLFKNVVYGALVR
jgi:CubicO group peptidase (beta-lactamase class C family)